MAKLLIRYRRCFTAALLGAVAAWPANVSAACKVQEIVHLPVTMVDMRPMVGALINGTEVLLIVDSGAFYSMLSPASAAELKLRTEATPLNLTVTGIGGEAKISVATVKLFTLAGIPLRDVQFLVGGSDTGGGGVGLLGQNVLRIADVEYDLAKGIIKLMREDDCKKANLAYWSVAGSSNYSYMDVKQATPLSPGTRGEAFINGAKITVLFDSGAAASFLSVRAAERAGIKTDAPDVKFAGDARGIGRTMIKTWIAPIASFKIGDEEIRNTHLRIGDIRVDDVDMLLGGDFFLSHRIYVASKRNKLFFTYNGGPVFNLNVLPTVTAAPAPAPAPGAESSTLEEPKNAAGFSRRGSAFAARRDFARALADLDRACELAPEEPNYFYERGIARGGNQQLLPALADFDQAIRLKADHVPALLARAELRIDSADSVHALEDLDAADRAASKEADARLRLAYAYARIDQVARAKGQLDLWIAAHDADSRMAGALNERCWLRAGLGQELQKALDDCNRAVRLADKKDVASAQVFNSRGFVRLRLGDYEKSVDDYGASLSLRPKDAWALYGRGIAQIRRGNVAQGQTDLKAAKEVWPPIADAFAKCGVIP